MNYYILTYLIYLPATALLTWAVANTLFRNGRTFLVDIFHGNTELADSVNKLLLVGFYLINMGYATLTLKVLQSVDDYREVIEILSTKLGTIILVLGGMHFFNLYIFYKLRKRAKAVECERNFIPQPEAPGKPEENWKNEL